MKNLVRALALSLVATGAFASAHIKNSTTEPTTVVKASALPIPCCPPDDPAACHINGN